jgi:hypothetical protein
MRFMINTYKDSCYFLNFTLQKRILKTQCWNWLLTPPPPPPHPARMSTFLASLYISRSSLCVARTVGACPYWMTGEEGVELNPATGTWTINMLPSILLYFPPCSMFGKKSWCQPHRRDLLSPKEDSNAAAAHLLPLNLSSLGSWERGGGGDHSCMWFRGHHHAKHTHQHTSHAFWGRIHRKTWCIAPYAVVDYNLTLCRQHMYNGQPSARVDLNPMPKSTLAPSQGFWIWHLYSHRWKQLLTPCGIWIRLSMCRYS